MTVEMREATFSFVGVWERLNVILKAMENLPSSSAESSASRKWASRSFLIASRAVDCSASALERFNVSHHVRNCGRASDLDSRNSVNAAKRFSVFSVRLSNQG
jgi:hypothetical protein